MDKSIHYLQNCDGRSHGACDGRCHGHILLPAVIVRRVSEIYKQKQVQKEIPPLKVLAGRVFAQHDPMGEKVMDAITATEYFKCCQKVVQDMN